MKTPFDKYIDKLRDKRNVALYGRNQEAVNAYTESIELAESYKSFERRAITSAFMWGAVTKTQYVSPITSGEDYYEKTFNTNEK